MNYRHLREYLLKSATNTTDPRLQSDMLSLFQQLSPDEVVQQNEDDEIMVPELSTGLPSQKTPVKEPEDVLLRQALPEIQLPNPETPEVFGKLTGSPTIKISMLTLMKRAYAMRVKMSAYIKDIPICDLPESVQAEVRRFVPKSPKDPIVIQYGLMVRELEQRADVQNYKVALETVKKELGALSKAKQEEAKDAFFKKVKEKFVLLVNDQIVDGHHFLAKAKFFNVTCSLPVLDLTPARFQ